MTQIMYACSRWAKINPWPARLLVILSHMLLIGLAWWLGSNLHDAGYMLPSYWLTGAVICTLVLCLFYPRRGHDHHRRTHYLRQKRFDLGLLATGFFMTFMICNRDFEDLFHIPSVFAVHRSTDMVSAQLDSCSLQQLASMKAFYQGPDFQNLSNKDKKHYVKSQLKALRHSHELNDTEKALILFFSILVGLGIIFFSAALSCSLACSGSDGLAILVMIGGIAGAVLLNVFLFKRLTGKHKPKGKPVSQRPG